MCCIGVRGVAWPLLLSPCNTTITLTEEAAAIHTANSKSYQAGQHTHIIYVYIYVYIYIYSYSYSYIYSYIYIYAYKFAYSCADIYTYVNFSASTYVNTYVDMYVECTLTCTFPFTLTYQECIKAALASTPSSGAINRPHRIARDDAMCVCAIAHFHHCGHPW